MHRKNVIFSLIITVGIILATFSQIAAPPAYDVVYVDGTGLGDNHFNTIEEALAGVNSGGTVYITAGHYIISDSLSITSDVTIIGEGADVVLIDADQGSFNVFNVEDVDFEISGCSVTGGETGMYIMSKLNYVNIYDNIIYGNACVGIATYLSESISGPYGNEQGYNALSISGNEIYDNGSQGIYISVFNSVNSIEIMENEVHDNGYAGIELSGDTSIAMAEIFSNTIYHNGISSSFTGIMVREMIGLTVELNIYDNEIFDEDGNGIHIIGDADGMYDFENAYIDDYMAIYDNDIHDCRENGIFMDIDMDLYDFPLMIIALASDSLGYESEYIDIYGNKIENNDQDGILIDLQVDIFYNLIGEETDGNEPPVYSIITIAENEIFDNERMGTYIAGQMELHSPIDAPLDGKEVEEYMEFLWIYRNEIYHNLGGGIILIGLPVMIENNLIAGNYGAAESQLDGQPMGAGIFVMESMHALVYNNTVLTNLNGIEFGHNYIEIINNIVAYNCNGIYYIGNGTEGVDEAVNCYLIHYNDVWDNGIDYEGLGDQTGYFGNISEDPLFYGMFDARLTPVSPCIDTGFRGLIGFVTEDIDSTQRPLGLGIDMGCYEMPGNIWSPKYVQPLATLSIAKANSMWGCIMENLPADLSEEAEMLIEEIQTLMGQAGSLANPVFTNGLMQQALGLMRELVVNLGCGCHS